jgi:translation elongation factor EF-1alpha
MVIVHINGAKVPGVLKRLNKILDGKGNVKKMHPRTIGSTEQAEVEIETTQLMCMETFKNSNAYGKVILRHKMCTLAVGKITQIKMYFEKLKST